MGPFTGFALFAGGMALYALLTQEKTPTVVHVCAPCRDASFTPYEPTKPEVHYHFTIVEGEADHARFAERPAPIRF